MRAWSVVLAAAVALSACRSGSVDTTKDVYEDWEAPECQIRVVNGQETKIPWDQVNPDSQWLDEVDHESPWPGTRYKHRVPIVKVEIWARDREGKPADPFKGEAWTGRFIEHGLNPKYQRSGIMGKRGY